MSGEYADQVEQILESVREALCGFPFVAGIVLGGSRSRGMQTAGSDIDIGIYYDADGLDLCALNAAATELDDEGRDGLVVPPGEWGNWVNGGGWLTVDGFHVDLLLRELGRVRAVVEETERGIFSNNYQTGHFHGYMSCMYRGELAVSRLLWSRDQAFRDLKRQAEQYPEALRKSLMGFFGFEAGFAISFAASNAGSGDRYYVGGNLARSVSCMNQVLFAYNRVYCINEKKAVLMADSFPAVPEHYREKVNRIFEVLGTSPEESCALCARLNEEVQRVIGAE